VKRIRIFNNLNIKTLKIHLKFKILNLKLRPLGNGCFDLRSGKNVKNTKRKLRNLVAGFTLIELIIVMAMIGIISSASFKLVRFSDTHRGLSIATTELKGAIRTAQTLALAPPIIEEGSNFRVICGFGVRNGSGVDSNKLEIFYSYSNSTPPDVKDCRRIATVGDTCGGNNACSEYETKFFEGFILSQGGNGVNIFFRSPYGKVFGEGIVKIMQDGGQNYLKEIEVNKYGKINTVKKAKN
jgi:prepilin-type N-terminal cleavage/methylation domain-containing protein